MAHISRSSRSRHVAQRGGESISAKRIVNVRLLIASAIVVVISCLGGWLWYEYQANGVAGILEQRAASLEKQGQWRDAAGYLSRYLQLKPDDHGARLRLIQATEQSAETWPQRRQLIGLLYQTLGRLPHRDDIRLKLANHLLEARDFKGAQVEARKLENSTNGDHRRAAQRIIALSLSAQARPGGPVSIENAAGELAKALAETPEDVALASWLSQLYREYPQSVAADDPATKADEIMDRLVAADPQNSQALIARYSYRRRYAIAKNAREDLETLLARDPNHVEALLLLASEELLSPTQQNQTAAEQKLRKVIEVQPTDPRGHIGLARLLIAKGERLQALDVLSHGRTQLRSSSIELDGLLADLLIDLNRLDDAAKVVAGLDDELRRMLPELTTDGRTRLENVARLLRARLNIARNELTQARRELTAVIASVAEADVTAGATERVHAQALLATVMTKLGQLDLAAAQWKALADQAPNYIEAHRRAGVAYLELGRPVDAVRHLELYVQAPSASPDAWISLVQAHLQQQLRLAPKERNWSDFLTTLDQAKKQLPQRWELPIAEVYYWRAVGTDDAKRRAIDQLRRLEEKRPNDTTLLISLVIGYQQLQSPADAERVLSWYDQCEPSRSRRAMLRSALRVQQSQVEEACKILTTALAEAGEDERPALQKARIRLLVEARQLDEALKAVSEFIAESPNDSTRLILGLEVALRCQDLVAAARWEDALKRRSLPDDFDWRYYRARRLLAQFAKLDQKSRSELESLIETLRSERPDWFPTIALAADYSDLSGNRSQAIEAYRSAIDFGDRRPEVFQRLVAALNTEGRFAEANLYLARLGTDEPTGGRIDPLAIALAAKENGLQAALDLAQHSVDRGSAGPDNYVWLANLLSLNGRQEEAEQVFKDGITRFPNDPRLWNALFGYLVQTKQPERAHNALKRLAEVVAADEPAKHFVLAQGHELLGDVTAAQEHYRAAISGNPKNVDARLRLAKSLLSSDVVAAREQLEHILKIDPRNSQARRYVASLLAASGDETDWSRAVELLQTNQRSDSAGDVADDRLRAMLLSQRGRNRAERLRNLESARRILMTRIGQSSGSALDLDHMLLSGLYEQEAALRDDSTLVQAARDALRPLVDRDNPPAEYLAKYIQFLLRHLEREPGATQRAAVDEGQRSVLFNDARSRIDDLEASLGSEPTGERLFIPISFRVRLHVAEDQSQQALALLNDFAGKHLPPTANNSNRGKLLLQLANLASSCGFHGQAEEWYRQLLAIAPDSYILLAKSLVDQKKTDEAVELCLRVGADRPVAQVATVLVQLLSTADISGDLHERVQSITAAALKADGDNVELLVTMAVRNVTLNNYDEAIKLFRRVLELNPNHTLALNNVATLLAERPNQLGEARKYVERAMAAAGRTPALLDTLGTILIRGGQLDEAVTALEEAVAGVATDPRYYFHLAVAYQRSGRENEAQLALETADKYGLDGAILTSGDRQLLASLKDKLLTAAFSD